MEEELGRETVLRGVGTRGRLKKRKKKEAKRKVKGK